MKIDEQKLREAIDDFIYTFAGKDDDDGTYWGHDTNLGTCEEEKELFIKDLKDIFK
jgi:hypothetical protein